MKKFFAKLIGFREVVKGQTPFHQREKIEHDLAEERRQQAMEHERERLKEVWKREEPSEAEILGPSDSAEKKD